MTLNRRYPGTTPFEKEQKETFFGREKDIENLLELIKFEALILLYSKSGLGKSSLLNAGIQPHLESEKNTRIVNIRFTRYSKEGVSPMDNIISKLASGSDKRGLLDRIINKENSLWYHIKKDQLEKEEQQKYILIFDQFEELFSYPEEEILQFKKQLADLLYVQIPQHFRDELNELLELDADFISHKEQEKLYQPIDIRVITSIRSDKMSQLNALTDYLPNVLKNYYELGALDRDRASDAIINPAKAEGWFISRKFSYDPILLNNILDYLTEKNTKTIETFQLQIICARAELISIRKRKTNPELAEQVVKHEELHDLKNIFAEHYNETISLIKEKEQQIVARKLLEDKLIVDENRVSLPDVVILKEVGMTNDLINHLVNSRILRAEPNTVGGLSYELSHDTLVDPILAARKVRVDKEEEEEKLRLKNEELRIAREKAEKERIEREKERKLQRQIIVIVSIAAVISIAFGVFAGVNMRIAQEEQAKTKAEQARTLELTITGNLRDANAYVEREEYEVAYKKYILLRDTILEGKTTEAIEKRINKCKELDSISKLFYNDLDEIDSLIKSTEIVDLQKAGNLFKQTEALKYKPGKTKLQNRLNTYQLQLNNVIKDKLRIAETMINAGLRNDAIQYIKDIEQLSPENQQITEFKEKHDIM